MPCQRYELRDFTDSITAFIHRFVIVAAVLAALTASAVEVQTNYAGFHVMLSTAQSSYQVGAPVEVAVTMTNGTRERVRWNLPIAGCSCAFGYFEVKLVGANTNLPCRWLDNYSRSGSEIVWQNIGESSRKVFNLAERFDLKAPGFYEVRLLGRMPTPIAFDNKEPTVPTPPLIINITNAPTGTSTPATK